MVLGLAAASLRGTAGSSSPAASENSHSMARLLETSLGNEALSSRLRRGEASNLREAFATLPLADQARIREAFGFATEEILSLGGNCDAAIRDRALLQIAGRLENRNRLAPAAAIYGALAAGEGETAARARTRWEAMNGIGLNGARAEFLARSFVREACRPEMLIGMGAAGLTYRVTRLAVAARLAGGLESAWQIRTAATSIGFLAETVAFTGATKAAGAAFGVSQDWSAPAVGREWASGALALLGLKSMGGLSSAALRRWARGSGAFEVFSRAALPQAAMLGGIMLGHRLEEQAGLRERRDGATDLVDSLVLLAQFNVAARALHGITGPGTRRFETILDAQTQAMSRMRRGSGVSPELWPSILGTGPRLVPAGGPGLAMMGNGGESRPEPTRSEGSAEPPVEQAAGGRSNGANGTNGAEAEAAANSTLPPAAPETLPPPAFDAQGARYHLPRTKYFEELRGDLSFEALVGYARAVERARLIGVNLRNTLQVPMVGPEEYSPYGAALVEHLRENPELVHSLTGKNERALIASPGTAILGLGAAGVGRDRILQAEAADAIMQGKAKYFLLTAGVSATPLCVRSYFSPEQVRELERLEPKARAEQARIWRAERFAQTVLAIAPNFGFINIEDAQGKDLPLIFGVLESLRGNTALWSDDMQGTGIITAAAMLGWAELSGRLDSRGGLGNARGVIFGAGAGAMGVYEELVHNGMQPENILVTDSRGALHAGRADVEADPYKVRMRSGIPEGMTVERFARDADFLINLGVKETFTEDPNWTRLVIEGLATEPFVGAMTNPEPGLSPDQVRAIRPDAYYGSGNQTYENPVNNFTAFGYIGAGALMARAGMISPAMTVAAARGIFEVAKLGPPAEWRDRLPPSRREFGRHWLVPRHDDLRLIAAEAGAVAKAAARDGVAMMLGSNPTPDLLQRFDREVDEQVALRQWTVSGLREEIGDQGRSYLAARYPKRYSPFRLEPGAEPLFEISPEIPVEAFEHFAGRMGLDSKDWQYLLNREGELRPAAFTEAMDRLLPGADTPASSRDLAQRELRVISQLATISPSLGLALAVERGRIQGENLGQFPTVFHREAALRTVLELVPEARPALERNFPDLPALPE